MNLIKSLGAKIGSLFHRSRPEEILLYVHKNRGLLWERISQFKEEILSLDTAVRKGTEEMDELFPTTHRIENGLYTREVFMPKGTVVVSYIHKQNHPSFFLSGEMSVLDDTGVVQRIKAPLKVFTEIGTQRVAYMHEDCVWACVYRTDAKTVEEAEKDVYTEDYLELPENVLKTKGVLCLV